MQIVRLLKKMVAFGLLNGTILVVALFLFSGQHRGLHLTYAESESNLLVTGSNHHYQLVLLGTSRARVFSRDDNHARVEAILGGPVANLAKGGGGGLMPAEVHLSYFYYRGNSAEHIVYLVDPWVFFAPINNENNTFFLRDEPFELFILAKLIGAGFPIARMSAYLQMIAVTDWRGISRYAAPGLTAGTLDRVDAEKVEQARRHYLSTYNNDRFSEYASYVKAINRLAEKNGSTVTYVMLPIMMRDFPGAAQVDGFLRDVALHDANVEYYNFIHAMGDKHYYYDHMHFNRHGIDHFVRHCLRPLLNGETPVFDQRTAQ